MQSSTLQFHQGNVLKNLASHYPKITDVILEYVQNGLDQNAKLIRVVINQRSRGVIVSDDGDGASESEFSSALRSIACSSKGDKKLGRFGIGLISAIGKCQSFTFTSTPKENPSAYTKWTFNTQKIISSPTIDGIPFDKLKDLTFSRDGGSRKGTVKFVPWRTEVCISSYTRDTTLSRLNIEDICSEILVRFNAAMKANQAQVDVTVIDENNERRNCIVRPKDFTGSPLEVVKITTACGVTIIKLFRSTNRKGVVSVGETYNSFRLDFNVFVNSLPANMKFSPELGKALTSGIFEGEITHNRIGLKVDRASFEANDYLGDFCSGIEKWFNDTGREHFEQASDDEKDLRFQRLGLETMSYIEGMLGLEEFEHLKEAIKRLKRGSVPPNRAKEGSLKDEYKSLSTGGESSGDNGGSSGGSGKDNDNPDPNRQPITVSGPKGQRRAYVRSKNLGLQLAHEVMPGKNVLWDVDRVTGVIAINVLHPLWLKCEDCSDSILREFQQYIVILALSMMTMNPDFESHYRMVLDQTIGPYVYLLTRGKSAKVASKTKPFKRVLTRKK